MDSIKDNITNDMGFDLISNLVCAVAGMMPYVGPILKPIISFVLHAIFDKNSDEKFKDIIGAMIAEYAYGTAVGEFKTLVETGILLEKSIEELKKINKKNKEDYEKIKIINDELIARNEICMNSALRIINIYKEVAENDIYNIFPKVHSIIAMASFIYCGLVLDTIKHGKDWGYRTIDGLQEQLENKSDEMFRFLTKYGPNGSYPRNETSLKAQQSLIYFRKEYNNLKNPQYEPVILINDKNYNNELKAYCKYIIVGKAFGEQLTHGYDGVAYDIPARVNYDSKPLSISFITEYIAYSILKIKIIHSCLGERPNGTFIEVFINECSEMKLQLYPPYWGDNSNIMDVFHKDTASNYQEIRYIYMEPKRIGGVISSIRFDIYNNDKLTRLSDTLIYHVEFEFLY